MENMNLCPHCGHQLKFEKVQGIILITCETCRIQSDLSSNTDIKAAFKNFKQMASLVDSFDSLRKWGQDLATSISKEKDS